MSPATSWLAEAPGFPGTYAMQDGKYTLDPEKAAKFHSREDCQEWCDQHPKENGDEKWVPIEHAWLD